MKSEGATYILIHTMCIIYMTAKYSCKIDDVQHSAGKECSCLYEAIRGAPNCSVLS